MVRGIWIGVGLLGLLATEVAAADEPRHEIEICHTANAGFVVHGSEGSVIIDGLFRKGLPDYQRASGALNEAMETAVPPFDKVRIVIASHDHADHFSAEALVRHVAHSPDTQYIVTPQARERMIASGLPKAAAGRVHGGHPAINKQKRVVHAGITVTVYRISHGKDRPIQNIGVLLKIGGFTVFHPGDMEPYPEELAEAGIKGLGVDALLVPFWLLMSEENSALVRQAFDAGVVVPMHVPDKEQGWMDEYGGLSGIRQLIDSHAPNALWLTGELDCRTFDGTSKGGR